MIVLDASIVVELLINSPLSSSISDELQRGGEFFIAPHLLDIEVMSALRRLSTAKSLDSHTWSVLVDALLALPIERYPHSVLLPRIAELRHNFGAYDAAYLALAEATESVLFTCDAKLQRGHHAKVKLFGS